MRFAKPSRLTWVFTGSLLVAAIPVLGQDSPESILPPGFGDPVESDRPAPKPSAPRAPAAGGGAERPSGPRLDLDIDGVERSAPSSPDVASSAPSGGGTQVAEGTEESDGNETADMPVLPDLPPSARRPVEWVGLIGEFDGGLGPTAFGSADGAFLAKVMRGTRAPIASRWGSILLRRALISRAEAPKGIAPADWVAERVWLLVRMGEADSARQLAQGVDADRQTDRMRDMALQAALASADPAAACPSADYAPGAYKQPQWMLTRAMCNALSGESAQASALVDSVRDHGLVKPIDALLAEKVVGAGGNTRRSVKILWENVKSLTTWRFGLAAATGVEIPATLIAADNDRVRAWRARAPLRTAEMRMSDADIAAGLGVFSNSAMVDLYSAAYDEADPGERSGKRFMQLRSAYAAGDSAGRVAALQALWGDKAASTTEGYGRLVLTARAAALLAPSASGDVADQAVASILSAGLVDRASRWFSEVSEGSVAWAQLALAVPGIVKSVDSGDVTGLDEGATGKRAQFFLAGVAGLGLASIEQANGMAESLEVALGKQDAWTRAIDGAATRGEKGSVMLLAGLGLQGKSWADVSPAYLYRVVAALTKVNMVDEARLIAAEAVARG